MHPTLTLTSDNNLIELDCPFYRREVIPIPISLCGYDEETMEKYSNIKNFILLTKIYVNKKLLGVIFMNTLAEEDTLICKEEWLDNFLNEDLYNILPDELEEHIHFNTCCIYNHEHPLHVFLFNL